jgi:hydrogenase expression/formation protein HypE
MKSDDSPDSNDVFSRPCAKKYGKALDLIDGRVDMTHGGGGKNMSQLVDELFIEAFGHELLRSKNDQAVFSVPSGRIVMSTDSHVVSPLFFPGGDIGSLSVHGTINDVAMSGAEPLYLSTGFILEEGFPLSDLKKIVSSMAQAQRESGVPIVTGDTKVVERGKGDGVFINTTGVGVIRNPNIQISSTNVRPGDKILVSGFIGDHGVAIMSKRANLDFVTDIVSDSAALHGLVKAMIEAVPCIHCLRDPTRGGVAATLNEIAHAAGVEMIVEEKLIPVRSAVNAACELLGLDPLNVANEGKLIAFCRSDDADRLLAAMRRHPLGENAAIVGEVLAAHDEPLVQIRSPYGGRRIVHWLAGEQLPRIC